MTCDKTDCRATLGRSSGTRAPQSGNRAALATIHSAMAIWTLRSRSNFMGPDYDGRAMAVQSGGSYVLFDAIFYVRRDFASVATRLMGAIAKWRSRPL